MPTSLVSLARRAAKALVGGGLLLPMAAQAITFTEIGDAPSLPPGQQIVSTTPLTAIQGALTAGDQDMFKIHLDGGSFSATVVNDAANGPDSQLFLFNSAGVGVLANDDAGPGLFFSSISAILPAGDYFLGISQFDNDPISAGGLIFPNTFIGQFGPTGAGGALPISGWSASGGNGFAYTISLTGASSVVGDNPSVPDESSSLLLLSFGLFSLLFMRHGFKR
jgi:hypothetical protein